MAWVMDANAILLNKVIAYNCVNHDIMCKYATLAYKVQLVGINEPPEVAVNALKTMITLMHCMNMPQSISALEITREAYEEQFQNMINNALMDNCIHTTPREIGTVGIKDILNRIY